MSAVELLSRLRRLDVRLWADGDQLCLDAPKGALSAELRSELAQRKTEILAFLHQARVGRRSAPPPLAPAHPGEPLPLSFAQERLWFLDRMEPGSAAYNVPLAARLAGPLDAAALARALAEIERRHQVLRTTFPAIEGRAVQVVGAPSVRPLPRVDLADLPGPRRLPEALLLAGRAAARPFDLARGPVWRAALLCLDAGGGDHALLLTLHHIVADGWSMGVLLRELSTLYEAFAASRPSPLPELPIQYADFAAWQRRWLDGEVLAEQLAYWRRQLAGDLPPLDLPTDRPRPPVQTHRGALRPIALGAPSAALRHLARESGATLFMVLLGAFKALLHRTTGRDDLVVGSPVTGLGTAAVEPLIGLFTNMLVLRSDLSGDPAFTELLGRVREVVLGAFLHQDLPFERLVEELKPERDLSRSPLFQVMLALESGGAEPASGGAGGLAFAPLPTGSGAARYELTLDLVDLVDLVGGTGGAVLGQLEYNSDLFEAATIERLAGHLLTLVEGIAADPGRRLSDLPLLTAAERHQTLVDWNDTAAPPLAAAGVHELILRQAERTPGATALVDGGARLTYRELDRRADRLARRLAVLGVGPESRVGICLRRSPDLAVALLGVLKAGAAYVPLDPAYPAERSSLVLADARPAAVLVDETTAGRLPETPAPRLALDDDAPPTSPEGATALPRADSTQAAYVIYTSGSTGRPKGVVVSHGSVVNFFAAMDAVLRPRAEEEGGPGTWLAVTSVAFDISVLELLWTLARGFTVVMPEQAGESRQPATVPRRRLDFSLFYFAEDAAEAAGVDRYRLLIEGARFADRRGFAAVWTPERHFHAFGGLYPNPSVTAAAIAAVTERVRVRAGSVVLPLHNPIRVAEEWALVDNLSGGRVDVSFASGWNPNDFLLAPEVYRERKEVMLRGIETVRRLWRGEALRVPDGAGNPVEVLVRPRPVQPELPVWVTAAGSPDTFRAAGGLGANLLTHLLGQSLEELAEKIAAYREARSRHGDGGRGQVTLMLHAFVGADLGEVRETVRPAMMRYLRSSLGLVRDLARGLGHDAVDPEDLPPDVLDELLAVAFDRYFETGSLLGTHETCRRMLHRLQAIGVDEVACLIDFGVATDAVLAGLEQLDRLRREVAAEAAEWEADASVAAVVRRHEVTHFQCTPSMAGMLTADPTALAALGSLSVLLLGGEALPPALADRLAPASPGEIRNLYGPTETTVWSATHRLGERPVPPGAGAVPIGRPLANTSIHLVDRAGRPVPIGVPGELLIGGAGVARGYHDRPDLTAERFVPDPFSEVPGARLYRTGDRARFLPDGTLEFRGRLDHQMKIRGHRIEPGEVEAHLDRHPAVAESAVVARRLAASGGEGEERLVAYVVPKVRSLAPRIDAATLDRLLDGQPRYRLPNGMVIAHLSDFQAGVGYREIFEDDVYFRHGITLADGACVVDAGADIGFFTLQVHQRCRAPRVYAFEPIPATFAALAANIEIYGLDVELFRCGVGAAAGEAEFTFYPLMPGLSGRFADAETDKQVVRAMIRRALPGDPENVAAGAGLDGEEVERVLAEYFATETHTCPIVPLSQVIRERGIERIDLLKLDVEGSEVEALRGLAPGDWDRIEQVVAEVHSRELLSEVSAILSERGFHLAVDDFVVVEEDGAGPGVAVFMVYATRRPAVAEAAPAAPSMASSGELRAFLLERLPDSMVPSTFVVLEALPRTPNGKVDRRALPAPEADRSASGTVWSAPATELERTVAGIWSEVLGLPRVGLHDNFFELGGTSLGIAQVHGRLAALLDRKLPMLELFRHPTVGALARYLAGEVGGAAPPPSLSEARERAETRAASRARRRQARTTSHHAVDAEETAHEQGR